jgi:hypothetical protein
LSTLRAAHSANRGLLCPRECVNGLRSARAVRLSLGAMRPFPSVPMKVRHLSPGIFRLEGAEGSSHSCPCSRSRLIQQVAPSRSVCADRRLYRRHALRHPNSRSSRRDRRMAYTALTVRRTLKPSTWAAGTRYELMWHGIVTETRFDRMAGQDMVAVWPQSRSADIGFRLGLSSTRYGYITASP